jgi:hypothetical protein
MTGGATLDGLLREFAREAVAECAGSFRRDLRKMLAEELAKVGVPAAKNDAMYVSVKAAAKIGGVHESTIRNWLKEGKLRPFHPEPRILRVRTDELHALMAGNLEGGGAEVIDLDAKVRGLTARAAKFNSKK